MSKLSKALLIIGSALLITGGIILAVYESTKKEVEKTLNDYIVEDYHSVADTLSPGTSFFFYEVETVLNGKIDSLEVDDVEVVEYTCILQTEKNTHFIRRNFINGTREVETVEGDTWGGCFPLSTPEFPISFEQALKNVTTAEYRTPDTKYMTIRRPMSNIYENAIYIFGSASRAGLCVDSITGEVMIFE